MLPLSLLLRCCYAGVTGAGIRIDENGDSEGNYTVLASIFSSEWQKIQISKKSNQTFSCRYQMKPIGMFNNMTTVTIVLPISIPFVDFSREFATKKLLLHPANCKEKFLENSVDF